jgi:hypothetical protein
VTFLLNGSVVPDAEQRAQLEARGVTVEEARIAEIRGQADVALEDGREVQLGGLFTMLRVRPNSSLAGDLGCAFEESPRGRSSAPTRCRRRAFRASLPAATRRAGRIRSCWPSAMEPPAGSRYIGRSPSGEIDATNST